jgi:hypothetical protein
VTATRIHGHEIMPTNDENQPFCTLGSPWAPLPQFQNWESSMSAQTSSVSDASSVLSSQASSCSNLNDDDPFTNPFGQDPFEAGLPSLTPLESPPILLELCRKAKHDMLGTSGIHAYKSPGIPPAAQSAWNKCKEKVLQAFCDAG